MGTLHEIKVQISASILFVMSLIVSSHLHISKWYFVIFGLEILTKRWLYAERFRSGAPSPGQAYVARYTATKLLLRCVILLIDHHSSAMLRHISLSVLMSRCSGRAAMIVKPFKRAGKLWQLMLAMLRDCATEKAFD